MKAQDLKLQDVNDKGLSFGENSIWNYYLMHILLIIKLAIAVKDGSNLLLSKFILKKNEYDIAVFNKKQEYGGSKVELDGIKHRKYAQCIIGNK